MFDSREENKSDASLVSGNSHIAIKLAFMVYEKFTGNVYGKKEIYHLGELQRIFRETLQQSAPVYWELDKNKQPTHCIKQQKWSALVSELRQRKNGIGHFYAQSKLIAEYAETYLISRSKRLSATGKPGDLVEQFFGEWIHFALNDLPTFEFNEITLEMLRKRIEYLDRAQKHETLFKLGKFRRNKNKSDTIASIRRTLESCLAVAAIEILRKCARDELDICHRNIEAYLLSCVEIIYYARETPVSHEPLHLRSYLDCTADSASEVAQTLYPIIWQSHSGALLKEILVCVGLEAFGEKTTPARGRSLPALEYFTAQFQADPVAWGKRKFDLPPWVDSPVEQLGVMQKLGECIIRVAKLNCLVHLAYDLAGKVGDEWAYGDPEGKRHLTALLHLLAENLAQLNQQIECFYQSHDRRRRKYNQLKQINPDATVNQNFNKIDDLQKLSLAIYKTLSVSMGAIAEQLNRYPKDSAALVNKQKRDFYCSLTGYIKIFQPEMQARFSLFDAEEKVTYTDAVMEEEELAVLNLPIKEHESYHGYYFCALPTFKNYIPKKANQRAWNLGDSYQDWVEGFFTRQYALFANYQQAVQQFNQSLLDLHSPKLIDVKARSINDCLQKIILQINREKPRWRFKLGFWPIKTKGWPFNREAANFAELLLQALRNIQAHLPILVEKVKHKPHQSTPAGSSAQHLMTSLIPELQYVVKSVQDSDQKQACLRKFLTWQAEDKLSQVDVLLPAELKKPAASQSFSEKCFAYAELQSSLEDKIAGWQLEDKVFSLFDSHAQAQQYYVLFLSYRDDAPAQIASYIVENCGKMIASLEAFIQDNFALHLDSVHQAKILIQLLKAVIPPLNTEQRSEELSKLHKMLDYYFQADFREEGFLPFCLLLSGNDNSQDPGKKNSILLNK